MTIDVIRYAPGAAFSMTETAVRAVGRGEIFRDLQAPEARSAGPVLPIPAGGSWAFGEPDSPGFAMIDEAVSAMGGRDDYRLCIDCAGEGYAFYEGPHDQLLERLRAHELPPDRVLLLTSRLGAASAYADWLVERKREAAFTPVYSPVQLYYLTGQHRGGVDDRLLSKLLRRGSPFWNPLRERKYLCLNYSPREARWATVLRLMREGLLGDGLVSFYGRFVDNGPLDVVQPLEFFDRALRKLGVPERDLALLPELDRMAPITLQEPPSSRMDKAYGAALPDFYARTYFSIVTESDFAGEAGERFTEKVLKAFLNFHPFVLVGTHGVLAELRRLGFRTFSPWIDESYDEIADPAVRLAAALDSAVALARMSHEDLRALHAELWPLLAHNFLQLVGGAASLVDIDPGLRALTADGVLL